MMMTQVDLVTRKVKSAKETLIRAAGRNSTAVSVILTSGLTLRERLGQITIEMLTRVGTEEDIPIHKAQQTTIKLVSGLRTATGIEESLQEMYNRSRWRT